MIYRICLIVVLFGVWLLWSGLFEPLLLGFGAMSCVIVLWILARMRVRMISDGFRKMISGDTARSICL